MTRTEIAQRRAVLARLRSDAVALASHFRLKLRSVDAEGPRVKRRYGVCYSDGSIRIRLCHVRTGKLLKYSALIDTLCHELTHLRHFNHATRFQMLYRQILAHARRTGVYRPGPVGDEAPRSPRPAVVARKPGPQQLELFAS